MKWLRYAFPQIEVEKVSPKAALFSIEHTDWQFWRPMKLVDIDADDNLVLIFPPGSEIEVFRYDSIQKSKIEAKTLSVPEFKAFVEQERQPVSTIEHLRSLLDVLAEKDIPESRLWNRLLSGGYSQDYIRRSWLRNTGKSLTNQQLAAIALYRL